jgi:hypothetical protein
VAVLILGALALAIRSLVIALASDETKIRWRLEEMVTGFNERHLAPIMEGFAPEFRDAGTNASRDEVREILVSLFFQQLEAKTGRFLLRAELVPEDLSVTVGEGSPRTASLAMHARFFELRDGGEQLLWDAHIEGTLAKKEDGWQWVRTTRVNHGDRRRFSRP